MKFGKEFGIHLEETLPEWRDKYLCYKPLKKFLKTIPSSAGESSSVIADGRRMDAVDVAEPPAPALADLQDWFVRMLSEELEKFNDFYVDKEEEFVIRFQELKERIERAKEKSCRNGVFSAESEFSEEMMNIRKDFVTIHGEMVLLKNYSSLNFAGIIKILKKYDKRTGGLLRLPFTRLAIGQPFFTAESLTRLVRECEDNLELLFPLEDEVIESASTSQTPPNVRVTDAEDMPASLGNKASDVYKMTIAAIRTIKGLKKESSTYNPLSLASIFGNQDNESTGAVTAENSGSDSMAVSLNGEVSLRVDDDVATE